jgi:hypothetical protein
MIPIPLDGKYRGPGGPDPKKSRAEREKELLDMANSRDGSGIIICLWKEAKGIPLGVDTAETISTLVRHEMIPEILAHEYQNG